VVTEQFQDNPWERWKGTSGSWTVADVVEIYGVEQKMIYQSPEEPSHVAWAGLWKEADGSIKASFSQVKGNPGLLPTYAPTYGRYGWDYWANAAKRDGLFLGFANEKEWQEVPATTTSTSPLLVSRDNGDAWECLGEDVMEGNNIRVAQAQDGSYVTAGGAIYKGDKRYRQGAGIAIICLKNGILVRTAYFRDPPKPTGTLVGVCESTDSGLTWSPLQWLSPAGADAEISSGATEENAMVETADGRILVVIRAEAANGRKAPVQTYLTRIGAGEYAATAPTWTPMSHSGMPELCRGSDGTIWYWGASGHWYSFDEGATWQHLGTVFYTHYGKMVTAKPKQMLCVTQCDISDSPYPYFYNSYMKQIRFSYRRTGVIRQADNGALAAVLSLNGTSFTNLHLKADIKVDQAGGLAFSISPDGSTYYVLAVVMPGGAQYDRWFPPETQPSSLSAHGGETVLMFPNGFPMAVLAKVDHAKLTVLRGIRLQKAQNGAWLQLQVKKEQDLLQGAVHTGDGPAVYIGCRDAAYSSGSIGLMTDGSRDEFKNLSAWASPLMIRDNWDIGEYAQ
jgi:hypothetical protein